MKKDNKDIKEEPVTEHVFDPENDPITKLEHFAIYNKWARKNKIPVKVPDESFYPKAKVRFQRFDQPSNVLKCRIRNNEIDWSGQLIPGCVYDLPVPVIKWLSQISEPIFAEVKAKHDIGGNRFVELTETKQVGEKARFSCSPMEYTY